MKRFTLNEAVRAIDQHGVLLTFPLANRPEPKSLWKHFFPRSAMRWEWDENGDTRVSDLWNLRMELSTSKRVVYAKWFQGRATFFSKPVFTALLADAHRLAPSPSTLSYEARQILETLEMDSPLSTKALRKASELQGKDLESTYQRALKELWTRLWIVGFGEVDDGAFPSLAVGATENLFEDLWRAARELPAEEIKKRLSLFGDTSAIAKQIERSRRQMTHVSAREF